MSSFAGSVFEKLNNLTSQLNQNASVSENLPSASLNVSARESRVGNGNSQQSYSRGHLNIDKRRPERGGYNIGLAKDQRNGEGIIPRERSDPANFRGGYRSNSVSSRDHQNIDKRRPEFGYNIGLAKDQRNGEDRSQRERSDSSANFRGGHRSNSVSSRGHQNIYNRRSEFGYNIGLAKDQRNGEDRSQRERSDSANFQGGHRSNSVSSRGHIQMTSRNKGQSTREECRVDSRILEPRNNVNAQGKPRARLGFKRLEDLTTKEPLKITVELANAYNGFSSLLDEVSFLKERPDWIPLICKLLAKVCVCEFPENKIKVLTIVSESNFIELILDYTAKIPSRRATEDAVQLFLNDAFSLLETLSNLFHVKATDLFLDPVRRLFGHITTIETFSGIKVDEEIKKSIFKLESRLKSMEQKSVSQVYQNFSYLDEGQPPEDFRNIDLYPCQHEILVDSEVFLRRSIVQGKYNDVEHYLDIQFRLLRQDFVSPLREGFKFLLETMNSSEKQRKRNSNVRLFKRCSFVNMETSKGGQIVYIVCFDMDNRLDHIAWEYNKWFMFGSLLFFSFDNFSSFILGTVFEKNSVLCRTKRTISVQLIGDIELNKEQFEQDVVMVESNIFFQPYYHVMKALKQFDESNFPMSRYILDVNPVIECPKYIKECRYITINNEEVDVLDDYSWPTPDDLQLDKFQFEAFKAALTQEFVVMQGPPGTGKTYLGLKIVETLLKNETILEHLGSPILLVCYTNHALDQFLEGILKYTRSIVRVGTQTKSEIIKPFELGEIRKKFMFDCGLNSAYLTMKQEMRDIVEIGKEIEEILKKIDGTVGIVRFEDLMPFMSHSHRNWLKSSEKLIGWLLLNNKFEDTLNVVEVSGEAVSDEETDLEKIWTQMKANDDESEEDEVRKELKQEDFEFWYENEKKNGVRRAGYHAVTVGFLQRQLGKEINSVRQLEDQYLILDRNHYAIMRNTLDVRIGVLEKSITVLKKQFAKRKKQPKATSDQTKSMKPLASMDVKKRWSLYWHWVNNLKSSMIERIKTIELQYRKISEQFFEARQLQDLQVLMKHQILGTTTTRAAQNHVMLMALKPKVVIVEEAAEVLEAHIVTALTSHCQHLILIGDHQQLRPNPTVFKLAKTYNLEVSLFERMIKNQLSYSTLRVQHRMRPEICDLITPAIYPKLENHSSVFDYPNIKGVTKNLFFVTHEAEEQHDDMMESHKNVREADFLLKLAEYFLLQGYSSEQVTILVTYSGQLIYLKQERKKSRIEDLKKVRLTTVDNYQGEESQIILLSLVRSNKENKIGFLSTPNRVCVALSRAKHGFYIMGNMKCLETIDIWSEIKQQLEMHKAIGPELILECQIHQNKTPVSTKEDFFKVAAGGCSSMCNTYLKCGHVCKSLCHPDDRDHILYKCPDKCTKTCPEKHPCKNQCYEECTQCRVLVNRSLNCGHKIDLHCYVDAISYPCQVMVDFRIDSCGHTAQVPCHVVCDPDQIKCPIPCSDRLLCGHACTRTCHVQDDPDHIEFKCMKPCERKNKGCSQDHNCSKLCFAECSLCNERVQKTLPCSHQYSLLCHIDETKVDCNRKCTQTLLCGHPCLKRCKEKCGNCFQIVEKIVLECEHRVNIRCSDIPERKHCKNACQRFLECGHQCSKLCSETCNFKDCIVLVDSEIASLCGHATKVSCKDKHLPKNELVLKALANCSAPCQQELLCGHLCEGTCSGCKQGRLHEMCKNKCGRTKICGHSCTVDCSALCPPCKMPCLTKCVHSKCVQPCGQTCPPCNEKCEWQCPHQRCSRRCSNFCNRPRCYKSCHKRLQCGHKCIGFCCEPCPSKCRICDKEEVETIFFGTEDELNARFVVLEDCGHFFESSAIETYLGVHQRPEQQSEAVEIVMQCCPQCKVPIVSTKRFMNRIRSIMKDIAFVKKRQSQTKQNIVALKMDAIARLDALRKFQPLQREKERFMRSSKHFSNLVQMLKSRVVDYVTLNEKGKKIRRVNYLSETQMHFYIFIVQFLERIKDRVVEINCVNGVSSAMLLQRMDDMLESIMNFPQEKISQQQQYDLACELDRFYALLYLFELKEAHHDFVHRDDLTRLYEKCLDEILCMTKFNKTKSQLVKDQLEALKEKASVLPGLSKKEYKDIFQAMLPSFQGSQQGHFFKCPNGHFYCITECGGAMEVAKCPDCDATIGGEQHRYVAGTQLASEVDGATAAAWPGTLT